MANNILNKYIDAINENKTTKGAYIYGDFGIGKTYHMKELLAATVKKTNYGNEHEIVVSTQTRGYLIVWPTIIDQLKQNMNAEKNGDKYHIERISNMDII